MSNNVQININLEKEKKIDEHFHVRKIDFPQHNFIEEKIQNKSKIEDIIIRCSDVRYLVTTTENFVNDGTLGQIKV